MAVHLQRRLSRPAGVRSTPWYGCPARPRTASHFTIALTDAGEACSRLARRVVVALLPSVPSL